MPFSINWKTIRVVRNSRWLFGTLLFGWIGSMAGVTPLWGDTFWGTTASGNARQFEFVCDTCPNPVTELSNLSDGGFGNNNANVEFSNGEATYNATAIFTGPNSLPHLGVLASSGIVVLSPGALFFSAGATARATEQYQYIGATSRDYTLQYDINGAVSGGILTEIAGGFTVFGSGFKPNQEIEPVLGFSFDHVNGDGTEKPVHLNGSVTFTVNPGDTIFVQGTLDSFVDSRSQQLEAVADASHTLDMSFTQGDTSLLIPAAVAASAETPEPISIALFGVGLIGVSLAVRRQNPRRLHDQKRREI
jgi:hypothetical protein